MTQIAKSNLTTEEKVAEITKEIGYAAVMIGTMARQFTTTSGQRAAVQKRGDMVQANTEKAFNKWSEKCGAGKFEKTELKAVTVATSETAGPLAKPMQALSVRGNHNQTTGKITLSVSMAKTPTGAIDEAALNGTAAHEIGHHQPVGQAWYKYNPVLGEGYANVFSKLSCKETQLPCKITAYPRATKAFNTLLEKVRAVGGEKAYYEALTQGPEAVKKYIPDLDNMCAGNTRAGTVIKNISSF
jgi:hypothetical protein